MKEMIDTQLLTANLLAFILLLNFKVVILITLQNECIVERKLRSNENQGIESYINENQGN